MISTELRLSCLLRSFNHSHLSISNSQCKRHQSGFSPSPSLACALSLNFGPTPRMTRNSFCFVHDSLDSLTSSSGSTSSGATPSENPEGLQLSWFDGDTEYTLLLEKTQLSTEFMIAEDCSFHSTLATPSEVSGGLKVPISTRKPHVKCVASRGTRTKERSKNAVTLQRTQCAEGENEQLKHILRSYKETTKKFNDRLKEAALASPPSTPKPTGKLVMPSNNSDIDVLSELTNDLDASFARLDAAFEAAKIRTFDSDFIRYDCVNSEVVPYVEVVDISVSALDFQQVANKMWRSTVHRCTIEPCCDDERLWHTEDSLVAKAQLMCRLASDEVVQFHYRVAAKSSWTTKIEWWWPGAGGFEAKTTYLGRPETKPVTPRPKSGSSEPGVTGSNILDVLITLGEEPYQRMATTLE
ncbi:hypothetical protein FI667_g11931, partial [Globisporangium splendens]